MNFFQLEDVNTLPPTWTEGKWGLGSKLEGVCMQRAYST